MTQFQALRHSQYLFSAPFLPVGRISLPLEGIAGCLWAVSDFTCVVVIRKQVQASGLYTCMAERCDKVEARPQMKSTIFLTLSLFPETFSGHADWGHLPVAFWPLGLHPSKKKEEGEAGQHHRSPALGSTSFTFIQLLASQGQILAFYSNKSHSILLSPSFVSDVFRALKTHTYFLLDWQNC